MLAKLSARDGKGKSAQDMSNNQPNAAHFLNKNRSTGKQLELP